MTLFSILILFSSCTNICAQKYDATLASYLEEEQYGGVILLFDYNNDEYYASNRLVMNEGVLPASTFKIFNTLLFLELGIVKDTSFTLPWDGTEYEHKGRKIDICIDDANHSIETILRTAHAVVDHLADDFVYFIEDNDEAQGPIEENFPAWRTVSYGMLTVALP